MDLPFSADEYAGRIRAARRKMLEQEIDVLLVSAPEDIFYLTGYGTKAVFAFQMLALGRTDGVGLVTRQIEDGNVRAALAGGAPIGTVATYRDTDDPLDCILRVLSEIDARSARVGVQKRNWYLTVSVFERLREYLGTGTELVDVSDLVEALRLTKSHAELELMRSAGVICDESLDAATKAVADGATENDVACAMITAMIRSGGEWVTTWPNIQSGWRGGLAHAPWSGELIEAGAPVLMEIAGVRSRYHAPGYRTVIHGEPRSALRSAIAAVEQAQAAGVAMMRSGVQLGDVYTVQREALEQHGFGHLIGHRTGYAVGIGFPPTWGPNSWTDIIAGNETRLASGMVFHLVLYGFEPGTFGLALGQTILVTDDGPEALTNLDGAEIVYT